VKYAFSTLACPSWTIAQVVDAALHMGYEAIELRLLDGEIIDPVADREKVKRAVSLCRTHGLEVCALDTSCRFNFSDPEERKQQVATLLNWIRLAQEVQVPRLRVFGGQESGRNGSTPSGDEENAWVAASLRSAAPEAEQASVTIMLETHDAFSSARRVATVLQAVHSPSVAALWDSHHPYRVGETVEEVIKVLGPYIALVHVKDARRVPGESAWQLVLMGEGEVPVREQLKVLEQYGYNGYVSVEWEKKWHPEIAEPEVALPQHIAWLKSVFEPEK